jgi:hypothetical protein
VRACSSNYLAVLGFFSKKLETAKQKYSAFNWELFTASLEICCWQMRDEKVWYQLPIAEYTFLL